MLRFKRSFLLSLATAIATTGYLERYAFDRNTIWVSVGLAMVLGIPWAYIVSNHLAPWFTARTPSRIRCLCQCLGAHLLAGGLFQACMYVASEVIPLTISPLVRVNLGLLFGGAIGLALVVTSLVGCLAHVGLTHNLRSTD